MKFVKPALAIDEQIDLLKSRGMSFSDPQVARQTLRFVNFFRLRAYWLPFEEGRAVGRGDLHTFRFGTTFEAVVERYVFDQRLKALLMEAIERVEIALRARWSNELAVQHGSHAYLDKTLFANEIRYERCMRFLRDEVERTHESFIAQYRETYLSPALPPIWAICEILSFGQLSQWADNLRHRADRQRIFKIFGFDEVVMCAFMHHAATVRNLCAHHCRVWNRRFTVTMKLPSRPSESASAFNREAPAKVYNTLTMLGLLFDLITPGSSWRRRVVRLLDSGGEELEPEMGFPVGWRELPHWFGQRG